MLQPLDFDLLNELVEISVILHTQKIVDDSGSIAVPLLFHGYSCMLYFRFFLLGRDGMPKRFSGSCDSFESQPPPNCSVIYARRDSFFAVFSDHSSAFTCSPLRFKTLRRFCRHSPE